jgi:hypothetical protein
LFLLFLITYVWILGIFIKKLSFSNFLEFSIPRILELFLLFLVTYVWILKKFILKLSFPTKLGLWGLGGLCFI